MYKPLILNDTSLWFYDAYSKYAGLAIHIKEEIAHIKTKYQQVRILDTFEFGKILVLNQYMYQAELGTELTEMLVHVPLNTKGLKKNVLLIGGGDGVNLSQIIKYPEVEQIDVVDIDEELTKLCQNYFFVDKSVWKDKRINLYFEDGYEFLKNSNKSYDLILSALSETFNADGSEGMAYRLYTNEFYKIAKKHLSAEGIFVSEGTTVHYTSQGYEWSKYAKELKKIFPIVKPYHFNSKRMPGGEFVLLFASRKYYPVADYYQRNTDLDANYYNPDIHRASFALPESMKKYLLRN